MNATPRNHTPRNTDRRTLGGAAAVLAEALGVPFMPWQRRAADVILELDPDGRLHYKEVYISVPRQSGKTTMTLALGLHRLLSVPNGRIWYTAQTGQSARERFVKELVPKATAVFGQDFFKINLGAGDTRMVVPSTNSQFRPHPPNDKYLHGEQSDLNLIDEPWAYTETQGDALMQAVIPTQNTRPNAQTVFLSTMGDASSTWWHTRIDAAVSNPRDRVAVIDYGLSPADDPTDIEAVINAHPAIGHTIEPAAIYGAAATMTPSEFARAYANRRTATRRSAFDADVLALVLTEELKIDIGSEVGMGVATSWDRSETAIYTAGWAPDGVTPVVELVDARPGTSWAIERVKELNERHRPVAFLADPKGPTSVLATTPELSDILTAPSSDQVAAGTADLVDRIETARICLRRNESMAHGLDVLAFRDVGDRGRFLDRRRSAGSIAHPEAAMLALAALTRAGEPEVSPVFSFGGVDHGTP